MKNDPHNDLHEVSIPHVFPDDILVFDQESGTWRAEPVEGLWELPVKIPDIIHRRFSTEKK